MEDSKVEYWLAADIISHCNNKPYGHKGDEVKIIADHENVLIVEAANGNRFAAPASLISSNKVKAEVITEESKSKSNNHYTGNTGPRTKAPAAGTQTTLF